MSKPPSDATASKTSEGLSRRELLAVTGEIAAATALVACGGTDTPSGDACAMMTGAIVATGAESLQVGQAKSFPSSDPLKAYLGFIVARDSKGFFALRNVCSHAGCQTSINATAQTYDCPCHGSRYNLDGSVKNGPATLPLKGFPICREADGKLVVAPNDTGSTDTTGRVQ